MTVDPLQGLNVSSENYDIHRVASIYYNSDGSINLNDWLARFYPKQMEVYNKVMSQTRERLLSL